MSPQTHTHSLLTQSIHTQVRLVPGGVADNREAGPEPLAFCYLQHWVITLLQTQCEKRQHGRQGETKGERGRRVRGKVEGAG